MSASREKTRSNGQVRHLEVVGQPHDFLAACHQQRHRDAGGEIRLLLEPRQDTLVDLMTLLRIELLDTLIQPAVDFLVCERGSFCVFESPDAHRERVWIDGSGERPAPETGLE